MNNKYKHVFVKIWKLLLPVIGIFFLLHFLKDITQDILHIASPLDTMGDIKEDLSHLPVWIQSIYTLIGIVSLFAEMVIIFLTPQAIKRKDFTRQDGYIVLAVIYMLLAFFLFMYSDPSINPYWGGN